MSRVMAYLAAGGLAISVAVHLLTFLPDASLAMDQLWTMHVVMFVPFVATILRMKALQPPGTGWRAFQHGLVRHVPPVVRVLAVAVFAYAFVNFFMTAPSGGGPMEREGHYYRASHGQILGEISEDEYRRLRTLEVRRFSGHWLVFYGVPAIFFGWVEPRARRDRDALRLARQ